MIDDARYWSLSWDARRVDVKQAVMCGLYLQQRLQESVSSPSALVFYAASCRLARDEKRKRGKIDCVCM